MRRKDHLKSFRLSVWLVILLVLAACDGGASTFQRTEPAASTPLIDLPMSAENDQNRQLSTAVPEIIISAADAEYLLMTNLYERSAPAVVNITTERVNNVNTIITSSGGSGFVYDELGHIVTNAHVVSDSREILVTFDDGYVTEARLVGADNFSDIAVIKVDVPTPAVSDESDVTDETDATDESGDTNEDSTANVPSNRLFPLTLGNSDTVKVGERAIVIGNPFGLASSMTTGIVSAVGRQIESASALGGNEPPGFQNPSIIQIDADINPGNSGGPLLNSRGEVIGVNTAIRSVSGLFEGVGFAVPSNTVRRVVPELIATGTVNYPWIGISARGNEEGLGVPGIAEALGLPVSRGILVSDVNDGSPAEIAGLRGGDRITLVRGSEVCVGGDIIVAIDDVYVESINELVAYLIANKAPGDEVTLRVVRGEETFDISLTLMERPTSTETRFCGTG